MRAFVALLLIAMTAQAATAVAQTNSPANPPTTALSPPANAGCGDGTAKSDIQPTVKLSSATLRTTPQRHVHILMRGTQTAGMFVKISQVGGKRVGGTEPGSYTCASPGTFTISIPLSDYGRKIVRRHGRLAVKLTFRLINGSGVTNKRVLSGVIKPG
jgi:hypothetical protein